MRMRNVGVRTTNQWTISAAVSVLLLAGPVLAQWPQWGGPNRDFKVEASGLADSWPSDGPKELWSRGLGSGLSAIAVDDGQLFTMYRDGEHEVVIALDADSGKTLWEHRYSAAINKEVDTRYSSGPNSTPTVHGGHVCTVGIKGIVQCLDAKTGKVLWSHDLVKELGAKIPNFGFASSPIVHGNTLITPAGGEGVGVVAFDLNNGSVIWKKHDFDNVYSSPIIIKIGGKEQVVLLANQEIVGLSPTDGTQLWRFEHVNQWKTNISTPVWGKDNLLFVSSGGDAGSRMLKLTASGGETEVKEVWAQRKIGVGQSNTVRVGDNLYSCASKGRDAFLTAMNAKTGELAWEQAGYKSGQMLHADGKLIVIDEEGVLTLGTATPKAFKVRSTKKIFETKSWTIPTLVGKRLFIRDNDKIVALDLG